jgi:phosphate transport system permease protein
MSRSQVATAPHPTPEAPQAGRRLWSVPARRKTVNALWWTLCSCSLVLVVGPTLWMLVGVVARAVPVFHWSVLTQDSQGASGGLRNAVLGTAVVGLGVLLVGGSVSVLTGIYLSEFATGRRQSILRGAYEILSGIPSIVLGYVGYVALVVSFGWGFSLAAGVLVLSVMSIPYIAKATESALDPAQDRAQVGITRDRHRHAGRTGAGDR